MPTPAEILLERVDQRLAELGKSRWWLSMQITDGKRHGVVTDIARRGFLPGEPRLRAMAEALDTTVDFLMGRTANPVQPISEVTFETIPQNWGRTLANTDRIPVLGTGLCDDLTVSDEEGGAMQIERLLLQTDHTVRMIDRPAALSNVRDAYAIYFQGTSMEPRFFQGEIGIVDPRRPPSPGDFVVVQLCDGASDDVITVLVKRLVRQNSSFVELFQYNPEMSFQIDRALVKRLHRICSPNEVFGGL